MFDFDRRHQELMLPVVRIRTHKSAGSGTVIYSKPNSKEEFSSYILTNHHVIADLIEVKDRWSTLLKRSTKTDVLGIPTVDFYRYQWKSRTVGETAIQGDIVAYDIEEDLALIKIRDINSVPSVAKLYPKDTESSLRATMPVFCVGAGMGLPPVITEGMLSQFGVEIDNREFWSATSATVFGNSGGALYLSESHELLGVPARIMLAGGMFSSSPVTHLMFAIPITRVYKFLEDQYFRFIYDESFTEKGEGEERKRLRDRAEHDMKDDSEDGEPESGE